MGSIKPRLVRSLFLLYVASVGLPSDSRGQSPANLAIPASEQGLSTNATGPQRFIAAHGRRTLISGYASEGLDVWAYPFQVLRDYRVSFREEGSTSSVRGEDIVSRVEYHPAWIERIYLGPSFVAHERLFAPLDLAGAVLSYSVESPRPIEIVVTAKPVLNLMWPGAVGGQSTRWDPKLQAFVLSEPLYGYTAVAGSPDIVNHDEPVNRAGQGAEGADLGFTLRPRGHGASSVFVVLNPPHSTNPGAAYSELLQRSEALLAEARDHYTRLHQDILALETPNARVNEAFAWAETAVDQAWVCNQDLGCGFVGGYGPTRANRRPQYDWFFSGDGMITGSAALADGDWPQARQELEFILRYQDKKSGMIWHELSQSASLIDWAGKYPYMFVHVDTTFAFLGAAAEYVQATGDRSFARAHWAELAAAYGYCRSVIDPHTALPRIPADKEGGNEQDRETDELDLSVSWVMAAHGFAALAAAADHADLAGEALQAEQKARAAIPGRYWDADQSFWISGHTVSGHAMAALRSGPPESLDLKLWSPAQAEKVLDRLASSSFQTSWGTRGVALGSTGFDPESYASGSVWPVGTAPVAEAFWRAHRPVTAYAVWQSLVPLSSLDSLGHMHEALAGTVYRSQAESVPEQSWSSAAFLSATVHGLLGLEYDGAANRLVFAPHTPVNWPEVNVKNVRLPEGLASFYLRRDAHTVSLEIQNEGAPFQLVFNPDLPLGARIDSARLNDRPVNALVESFPQQSAARLEVNVPHGQSTLRLQSSGGIAVLQSVPEVRLGEPDTALHVVRIQLDHNTLHLAMDAPIDRSSELTLQSTWRVGQVNGATVKRIDDVQTALIFAPVAEPERGQSPTYRRIEATVQMIP